MTDTPSRRPRRKSLALLVVALLASAMSFGFLGSPAEASTVSCQKQSWTWSTVCSKTVKVKSPTYDAARCQSVKDARASLSRATSVTGELRGILAVFGIALSRTGSILYWFQKSAIDTKLSWDQYRYCTYWTSGKVSCSTNYYSTCRP